MVLLITRAFMVIEVVGGLFTGSLALLADAGHMLTELAALGQIRRPRCECGTHQAAR